MYEQHVLASLGDEGVLAGQRVDAAVEYDVARDQLVHGIQRVGKRLGMRRVGLELTLPIAWHVEVLLADVIDAVVVEWVALAVLEAVTGEYHDDTAHAGSDVPGDHRTARDAVIDEHTGAGRLPTKHHLLSRA